MITPGWRNIVVDGAEVWAYVGGERIEGFSAPAGVPIRVTIDGAEYLMQITRLGSASFEADILGPAPTAEHGIAAEGSGEMTDDQRAVAQANSAAIEPATPEHHEDEHGE